MREKLTCVMTIFLVFGVFFSANATALKATEEAYIFTVDTQSFLLYSKKVKIEYEKDNISSKAQALLNAMADSIRFECQDDGLFPDVKNGLTVKVEGRTASVNFSKEFAEEHVGGSLGETMTIHAIVKTLTGLNEIEIVQFSVDGTAGAPLAGHLDLTKPFTCEK